LWFSPNILTTAWSVTDEPFLSFCVGMEVKIYVFVQKHMYAVHSKYDTGWTLCEYKYYVHILQT